MSQLTSPLSHLESRERRRVRRLSVQHEVGSPPTAQVVELPGESQEGQSATVAAAAGQWGKTPSGWSRDPSPAADSGRQKLMRALRKHAGGRRSVSLEPPPLKIPNASPELMALYREQYGYMARAIQAKGRLTAAERECAELEACVRRACGVLGPLCRRRCLPSSSVPPLALDPASFLLRRRAQ